MNVIKRDGQEVIFEKQKIYEAVMGAVGDISTTHPTEKAEELAQTIADKLESKYGRRSRAISVEEIQDDVETDLMRARAYEVAKAYIRWRYDHELKRNGGNIDGKILSLVDGNNEEAKQENSNKNPIVNSTMRDYMAGEVSRDLTERILLPDDIVKAHKEGLIHFHDSDYYAQHMFNCCLVNLDDMLQNGTVISDVLIEKPHSFSTACNIASQIIAQVASNQYGGQTVSLAHLAPFVDVSRKKIREEVETELQMVGAKHTLMQREQIVNERLRREIAKGIQTIQYQVQTLLTTNGQAPFITMFMYLDEVPEGQTRDDLAMIIEETVKQRYEGVKNEKGVFITPAFPKLIYVLDEDNINEGSKYYYLTQLCAKCSAKRLVPDYISAKKMLEYKGDVYGCMGCRSFLTPDRFTDNGIGNIANALNYQDKIHRYYGRLTA